MIGNKETDFLEMGNGIKGSVGCKGIENNQDIYVNPFLTMNVIIMYWKHISVKM